MGYYGVSSDFVEKTRPYTLWRVLTESPAVVAKQYSIFVIRYFTEIGGSVLLVAGALLARRGEGRGWMMLALPAIALTFLLAAKFYTDRAILFQLIVWYVVLGRMLQGLFADRDLWLPRVTAAVLVAAVAVSSVVDVGRTWSRMAGLKARNSEVTALLRREGITNSRQVFTTHLSYYLADDPAGGAFYPHDTWLLYDEHYAGAFPHAYLTDVQSLTAFVERHRIRFLLLGPLTGELSSQVYQAQRSGDLGPEYRRIAAWNDVSLFEYSGRPGR
jgi:hypothetical protein